MTPLPCVQIRSFVGLSKKEKEHLLYLSPQMISTFCVGLFFFFFLFVIASHQLGSLTFEMRGGTAGRGTVGYVIECCAKINVKAYWVHSMFSREWKAKFQLLLPIICKMSKFFKLKLKKHQKHQEVMRNQLSWCFQTSEGVILAFDWC